MENIHRFDSFAEYCRSILQQPSESPLGELINQVEEAARWRDKKRNSVTATNRRTQSESVYRSVRDAVFLYYLMIKRNEEYLEESRINHLLLGLLKEQLCRLFDYVYGRNSDAYDVLEDEFHWGKNRTKQWVGSITMLLNKLYVLSAINRHISNRYFNGHQILWANDIKELRDQVNEAEELVNLFNSADLLHEVDQKIDLMEQKNISPDQLHKSVAKCRYLARAEALYFMGEHKAATREIEKIVTRDSSTTLPTA
jgi:hypothetical protein